MNRLETVTNWFGQTATYAYDAAGRLTSLENFNGTVTAYVYDNADRLVSVASKDSSGGDIAAYSFTLDANGNRTVGDTVIPKVPIQANADVLYGYNDTRNRLMTDGSQNFAYDYEGQLFLKGETAFGFDVRHRLHNIGSDIIFDYDSADRRLKATRNGVITQYIYDAAGNLLAEANESGVITRYYIHGMGLLAMVQAANSYCYHPN